MMYCIVSGDYSKTHYHAIKTLSEAYAKIDYLKSENIDITCKIITEDQFKNHHIKIDRKINR